MAQVQQSQKDPLQKYVLKLVYVNAFYTSDRKVLIKGMILLLGSTWRA